MNVHRWRKLEGSDPVMYELIQKVPCLGNATCRGQRGKRKKNVFLTKKGGKAQQEMGGFEQQFGGYDFLHTP